MTTLYRLYSAWVALCAHHRFRLKNSCSALSLLVEVLVGIEFVATCIDLAEKESAHSSALSCVQNLVCELPPLRFASWALAVVLKENFVVSKRKL